MKALHRTVGLSLLLLGVVTTSAAASAKKTYSLKRELKLIDPASVGMSAERLKAVDAAIERAIADGVTPGAALAVGRKGGLVRFRGYGHLDWHDLTAVDERSIFDLASLTKPVATATAAMFLVQDQRLDLDAPLATYLAEFRGVKDRRTMTARHLLNHTSGLPIGGSLAGVVDRAAVPAFMARVKLRAQPGRRTEYSDYGMILLGTLVERIAAEPLDLFLRRRLLDPLGLEDTGFNPFTWAQAMPPSSTGRSPFDFLSGINALYARIAPTERTRLGHLRGVVHDPVAAKLAGIAGHAGLFSSVHDLTIFAQLMLGFGRIDDQRLLDSTLVARFTRRPSATSRYALGWELARVGGSSGNLFSPSAFGHTGFTGTSIWIDPDRELFVVLLTNRVNPSARENRHGALRREVHDAVQESLLRRVPVPRPIAR